MWSTDPRLEFKTRALILLAFSLLLSSCKESPQEDQPKGSQQQPVDSNKVDPGQKNTDEAELVALDIKLPGAHFEGTPTNIRVPNLETPLGRARPPFYAPAGTTNVAFGKPVTSTPNEEPIWGDVEMATDGDKEATDGSYVELGAFERSITIDLGASFNIYAILFWHYHKEARVYFDVVVQVADDPDFAGNVRTLFNNDVDNSSGSGIGEDMHYVDTSEGKLIDAGGVKARYVRLHSNGNNADELNHYTEVEVFGRPAQ